MAIAGHETIVARITDATHNIFATDALICHSNGFKIFRNLSTAIIINMNVEAFVQTPFMNLANLQSHPGLNVNWSRTMTISRGIATQHEHKSIAAKVRTKH
jgi:hypothetical protein